MKRLVEFPLQEGGSIFVQVDEPDTGGTVRAARGDNVEKARGTFEEALNKVLPAINSVVVQLQGMDSSPNEIEVDLWYQFEHSGWPYRIYLCWFRDEFRGDCALDGEG